MFPKGDFLGLLICCSQKNSDQETLKIPFVAISFKSNLRMNIYLYLVCVCVCVCVVCCVCVCVCVYFFLVLFFFVFIPETVDE